MPAGEAIPKMSTARQMRWSSGGLAALALAWLLSACATTEQTSGASPAGFLRNYSQLRPGGEEEAQLVFFHPSVDWGYYDRVMIDPVTIWHGEDSDLSRVPREDLQALADYLHWKLETALETDYTIADRPGAGVLRIRAAITTAKGSAVMLDMLSTLGPQRILSQATKLVTGTHAFVGKAAIEAEILDSLSGTRLAAMVDERAGGKTASGVTDEWSDVTEAYGYWADRLRLRLAELRAR